MYTSCSKSNIQRCVAQHPEQGIMDRQIFPCHCQTKWDIYLSDTRVQLWWRRNRGSVFARTGAPALSSHHHDRSFLSDCFSSDPQKWKSQCTRSRMNRRCARHSFQSSGILFLTTFWDMSSSGPWPHRKSEDMLLVHYIQYLRKLRCTGVCKHWTIVPSL